jgi:homotetrameric cytidine deaminase
VGDRRDEENGREERSRIAMARVYRVTGHALASIFNPVANAETAMSLTSVTRPALETLLERARQAAQNSYSPYSGFKVGAALLLTRGETVTGTNVENVSYGLTICAERSALVRAVAEYGPDIRIAAVAVANLNDAPSPPCGACRQVLAEFVLPDAPVAFPAATGMRVMSFSEILPLAFDLKLK